MMLAFMLCISAFLFILSIHPFLTYAVSLRLMRRFGVTSGARPVAGAGVSGLSFAVCVPAYNEEAVIGAKIDNLVALRRATRWPVEILVYVDGRRYPVDARAAI